MSCLFCTHITEEQIVIETAYFKVVFNIDPIQVGHLLIIAKSHLMDIRELTDAEWLELLKLQQAIVTLFEQHFAVTGVTVMQNNGTILDEGTHFHVHIIPRYSNDRFWDNQAVREHPLSEQALRHQLRTCVHLK